MAGRGVARTGSRHESPRSVPWFVVPPILGAGQSRPGRARLREKHGRHDVRALASAHPCRHLCRRRVRSTRCRSRRRSGLRVQLVGSSARGDDVGRPGVPGDRRARCTITQADMRCSPAALRVQRNYGRFEGAIRSRDDAEAVPESEQRVALGLGAGCRLQRHQRNFSVLTCGRRFTSVFAEGKQSAPLKSALTGPDFDIRTAAPEAAA